jgi:hypothetical protein
MSKSPFISSTGGVFIDDKGGERHRNFDTDERVVQNLFLDTVRGDRNSFTRSQATKSICFLRPGPLRYTKQDELAIMHPDWYMRQDAAFDQYYHPADYNNDSVDLRRWRQYRYGPGSASTTNYATNERSTAFGAFGYIQQDWRSMPFRTNGQNAFFPDVITRWPMISWIDVPGTQIGNIFKHPPGRSAWYNEVGQTALSQGAIEIEGTFSPPENMLDHYGYQIYYTKTGGTGRPGDPANPDLTAAIDGTNGSVTTSSDVFTDGAAQGLFAVGVHDQGNHYIRVNGGNNPGTFLITAVNDVDNVVVDATTIGQPFTTEGSLSWEMVSGPVGEYFWRRKVDHSYEYWSSSETYNYGTIPHSGGMNHEIAQSWDQRTPPMRTMHDRGACWWGCAARSDSLLTEGRLYRYMHMSPQAYEPMNDPSKWSGTWPTGLDAFTDMCIDDQDKMWACMRAASNDPSSNAVVRWDPYPGGNSHTPQHLSNFNRQVDNSDAGGLAAVDCFGMLADNSQAYAAGTRIWVFSYWDEDLPADEGGISYTDDYGATWKRLHYLTTITGTASVSAGTAAVTGVGTAFTTELAVGDWMRFAGDSRSYEIQAIADDNNLTLATNHGPGASGVAIQRGALTLDQSRIYGNSSVGNGGSGDYTVPGACDWDTDGNIYWINYARTGVQKWDESAGQVVEVTAAQMSTHYTVTSGSQLKTVAVQRIPHPHGGSDHPLQNMIWVGTYSQGGVAVWPVFDGTHTRYHWSAADNWPDTIHFPSGTSTMYTCQAKLEPTTGVMAWFFMHQSGSFDVAGKNTIYSHYNGLANTRIGLLINNGSSAGGAVNIDQVSQRCAFLASRYDDLGMGRKFDCFQSNDTGQYNNSPAGLGAGPWICWRWTGSAWVKGPVNAYNGHLYFDGVSDPTFSMPNVDYPMSLGSGVKRMHADFQPLDPDMGMKLRFVDASIQSTAQDQQFLVDENSTFMCFIGVGKDNTQEARYFTDMYVAPTVLRENYESVKNVDSLWTVDGGVDGGFTTATSTASWPTMQRGVAEYDYYSTRNYAGPPYNEFFVNHLGNTPSRFKQYMATMRLKPEGEFTGDGSVTSASAVFTTGGAHTFVAGDVGKSIFIEGLNGATPDVDNGQAVILSVDSPTTVTTDKTFAATNGSLRWKLVDVPVVSYLVAFFENAYQINAVRYMRWQAYSSMDKGVSWDLVKKRDDLVAGIPDSVDWTSKWDPGFYASDNTFMRGSISGTAAPDASFAMICDLTDLPENVRRRQHWKYWTYDAQNYGNAFRLGSFQLLDANRRPMVPDNNKMDDSDDAAFDGSFLLRQRLRVWTGGNNASAVDDGDGDQYTDQVTMPGENFYLQSGSNNAQLSGSDFIGGSWTPEDVGKFIRIVNAVNPENEGWALVTAYVGAGQVTTDKAFTAETNTFDWQVTWVGENDLLKVYDSLYHQVLGQNLDIKEFTISDVPTASTLTLVNKELPLSVSGVSFAVNRVIPDGWNEPPIKTSFDTLQATGQTVEPGLWTGASTPLEFVVLEEDLGSPTATTAADSDGDGRVEKVTLPVTLVAEAVAGDMIMLDGGGGRRVYEIKSIARDVPGPGQTEVIVTYDELFPSSTFTWQVMRRRGLQHEADRMLYFLKETP